MKTFLKVLLIAFLLQLFAFPANAARSLTIFSDKKSLFGNEEMLVKASPSGFITGETIYLKGAFYQDGSTNYFGYTKKSEEWVKNGDSYLNHKNINIGDWDQSLIVKSDFLDSGYKGEGGCKLKIGFYYLTSSNKISSINWSSNTLDIDLSEPDPTPEPTNIPTDLSTAVPTKSPTLVPTLKTTVATIKPTTRVTPTTVAKREEDENKKEESLQIEDSKDQSSKEVDSTKTAVLGTSSSDNLIAKVFIAAGAILLITCGILIFRSFRMKRSQI